MQHETTYVGPRLVLVIERNERTAGDRCRFQIAADASVNEHWLPIDFAAIGSDEAMARLARALMFRMRLHSVAHVLNRLD